MEGGAFDGGKELVLRGVYEIPAEGDAAEFGIDEDGAVAVVPTEAQEAGLTGFVGFKTLGERRDGGGGTAGDAVEDVANGGEAGFDTGMAIANTSMDQYGTSTQTGTCTFNFFGTAAPAAVTTAAAVDPGTVYTNLTSVLAPGFQGYVIVDCQFQYAHGFAFITQIGTFLGTEGYLALIIPDPPNPRLPNFPAPGPSGEQLSN